MSREVEEETIQVIIDEVEFTPNAIFGLNWSEFGATASLTLILSLFVTLPLSSFCFGKVWYGLILSFAFAAIFSVWFSKKASMLKRGRPSYLLWAEWKRKVQNMGILNFGLVKNTEWDNKSNRVKK